MLPQCYCNGTAYFYRSATVARASFPQSKHKFTVAFGSIAIWELIPQMQVPDQELRRCKWLLTLTNSGPWLGVVTTGFPLEPHVHLITCRSRLRKSFRAALKLMNTALISGGETWMRVVISEFELEQLRQLRYHVNGRDAKPRRLPNSPSCGLR